MLKMRKLTCFLCAVSVCFGQPYPPNFPETFMTQYLRSGPPMTGDGVWVHNFEKGHFKCTFLPHIPHPYPEMTIKIQFFDQHIEYAIIKTGNEKGKVVNCSKNIISQDQKPPQTWEWVQRSHNSPYYDPDGNITYSNAWSLDTDTGYRQIVLNGYNSTVPYLLIEVEKNVTTKIEFDSYQSKTPAESEFEIPDVCN